MRQLAPNSHKFRQSLPMSWMWSEYVGRGLAIEIRLGDKIALRIVGRALGHTERQSAARTAAEVVVSHIGFSHYFHPEHYCRRRVEQPPLLPLNSTQ